MSDSLVKSASLLPHQSIVFSLVDDTCLVEQASSFQQKTGLQVEARLVETDAELMAWLMY